MKYTQFQRLAKKGYQINIHYQKLYKNIDEKGLRLFYCDKNLGEFDVEESISPIEDIKLFIRNSKNPDKKNYFFGRAR